MERDLEENLLCETNSRSVKHQQWVGESVKMGMYLHIYILYYIL